MSTANEALVDEIREAVAEAERQMGNNPVGSPVWAIFMAKRGSAKRELRQMEES